MSVVDILRACYARQKAQGPNTEIALVVPGAWPDSGTKRLLGRRGGPVGRCLAENERDVLCVFKTDEVIAYIEAKIPVIDGDALLKGPR